MRRPVCLGPLIAGVDHLALHGDDVSQFAPSCYLVEIGIDGPFIESNVLVVDEAKTVQHDDLMIVESDEGQRFTRRSGSAGACC